MPSNIRFLKYTFNDGTEAEHFSVDFSQNLDVHKQHLPFVINDLSSFKIKKELIGTQFSSILEIGADDGVLQLSRNYGEDSLTTEPSGEEDVFGWIKLKLGREFSEEILVNQLFTASDDPEDLKTQIKAMFTNPNVIREKKELSNDIKQELEQLGGEKASKLVEKLKELQKLETDINSQKRAEELQIKLEELVKQEEEIKLKLESVNGIIAQQQKMRASLQKFGGMANSNLDAESQKMQQEIQILRQQELQQLRDLAANKSDRGRLGRMIEASKVPAITPFLSVGALILGIVGLAMTGQVQILLVGFGTAFVSFLLWFNATIAPKEFNLLASTDESTSEVAPSAPAAANSNKLQRVAAIERFFVSKAWINALRREERGLQQQITQALGGKDYSTIQQDQQAVQQQSSQLKRELEAIGSKELTPEEYLKKRRSIDMIKIDKARFEAELRKTDNYDKVMDLINSLVDPESRGGDPDLGLEMERLIEGFDRLRVKDNQIELHSQTTDQWELIDLDLNQLIGILLYLKLMIWEQDPTFPFLLVNVLNKLEHGVKDYINGRINELSDVGQLVIINIAL